MNANPPHAFGLRALACLSRLCALASQHNCRGSSSFNPSVWALHIHVEQVVPVTESCNKSRYQVLSLFDLPVTSHDLFVLTKLFLLSFSNLEGAFAQRTKTIF